nr:hypothetical protein [Propionicimonas sp.]
MTQLASRPSTARVRGGVRPRWMLPATLVIAALVLTTSLLGLFTAWPYAAETANWQLQARGQDLGNLLAVVVLLGGGTTAARGSLRGLLVWSGAQLYLAYAFAIYALAVHFGALFLPYVAVLGLSVYALGFGLRWWEGGVRIAPRPLAAETVVLAGIAAVFCLLWLGLIVPALLAGTVPSELVETGLVANPVHVLDLALVLPGMLITAVLARRGSAAAQVLVGPWLVFAVLMAASILITLVLSGAAVPAAAVGALAAVAAATGWVVVRSAIPERAALRGVLSRSGRSTPEM